MVKINFTINPEVQRILYTALLSLAGALIGLLVIGTIFGIARSDDAKPIVHLGKQTGTGTSQTYNDDIRVFSGLGRLRIPLFNSSTLVLSIAFPYHHNDIAFTEELAVKINEFKAIATDYFSSFPPDIASQIDEETAKTEIIRRYNEILRLGRIEALYFSDMMVLKASE
jgi:flagellar basal body-associated protein FliL